MKGLLRKKDIASDLAGSGLKRMLNVRHLTMLGIGAIVGTGVFVITGQAAAEYAGPALTISFALSALGCIFAGLCYAELAAMIPVTGSVYAYSYITMGELPAWLIGWNLILEYLFSCAVVAIGWSGYMQNLLEGWGVHLPAHIAQATLIHNGGEWAWSGSIVNFPAMFIVALVTTMMLAGTGQSARVNNIIVFIKVIVILLFVGFGLAYIDTGNWTPYIPPNTTGEFGRFGWSGIVRGAGVVFFAYLGFDALSTMSQEVRRPQRDMPRGILISLIVCALLYVAVTAVLTGIVHYTELNVEAPLALAVDKAGKGMAWIGPLIKIGAIAGMSSVILVMMMGQSRIYYAISGDGLLPAGLSKVSARHGTPPNAVILSGILTGLVAGIFPLSAVSELVSIGTLMAFAVVCISVLALRRTHAHWQRPFKTPFVPYIPILGAGICILQMSALSANTWMRLVVWIAAGLVIYFVYSRRRSKLQKI